MLASRAQSIRMFTGSRSGRSLLLEIVRPTISTFANFANPSKRRRRPSADGIEEQMHAFGASRPDLSGEVRSAVIEAGVRAQFLGNDGAFLRAAGNADDFHARKFAELDGVAADRAGGGRHDKRLTRHRAAEHLHRAIGGEARRVERRQPQGLVNSGVAGSKVLRPCDGVFLPAKPAGNEVAVSPASPPTTWPRTSQSINSPIANAV